MSTLSIKKPTLEQQRASDAWKAISKHYPEKCHKDYVNAAKSLPSLIMNSGLMQTLAFCKDKDKEYEKIATSLRAWLSYRFGREALPEDFNRFMTALMNEKDAQRYQRINAEALTWLKWLRQMAAARQ